MIIFLSLDMGSYMYVSGVNKTSGSTSLLKTSWLTIKENDHCLDFDYAVKDGMKLEVVAEGRDGNNRTLQSFSSSTSKSHNQFKLTTSIVPTQYRVNIKMRKL